MRPQVVGTVYSPETLQAALTLQADTAPDWLELRVDGFARAPETLDRLVAASPRPLLVTVRHPAEGGIDAGSTLDERRRLYGRFLPEAAAIDVEVRSLRALRGTVNEALAATRLVIASFHDFEGTPSLRRLRAAAARAREAGADVLKVATTVQTPGDLATLFALLEAESGMRVAAMGMGRLGRASRPALAAAGSEFNYAYLGKAPQVPGQWLAAELRARIDEVS